MNVEHYAIRCDFEVEFSGVLAPEIARLGPQEQAFAKNHRFNAVLELHAQLTRH